MMEGDVVRVLFDGCEELVQYYLGLRRAVADAGSDDGVEEEMMNDNREVSASPRCVCDPRDEVMIKRIQTSGYSCHTTRRDICDTGVDPDLQGYSSKQTAIDPEDGDGEETSPAVGLEAGDSCMEGDDDSLFECGHQGCTRKFSSLSAFESHYHSCHHYTCTTCRRVFVSSFMLDIHIQENHDSYFQVLCSKIDMYQCLVEGCDVKFRTSDVRRQHLVSQHKFPANFYFHKPVTGNHPKTGPKNKPGSCENDKMECDITADGASGARESTTKTGRAVQSPRVPTQICFGRGSRRALPRSKHENPAVKKSSLVMEER